MWGIAKYRALNYWKRERVLVLALADHQRVKFSYRVLIQMLRGLSVPLEASDRGWKFFHLQILVLPNSGSVKDSLVIDSETPFNQRTYLEIDRRLLDAKMKYGFWLSSSGNRFRACSYPAHYFAFDLQRYSIWRIPLEILNPSSRESVLGTLSRSNPDENLGHVEFSSSLDKAQILEFYRRLWSGRFHYAAAKYLDYLFELNPYQGANPRHFGLKQNEDLISIGSAIPFPYLVDGKEKIGAMMSGWWRFPEIPRSALGGQANIFRSMEASSSFLTAYNPSAETNSVYEKLYARARLFRLRRSFVPKKTRPIEYQTFDHAPPELFSIADEMTKGLRVAVKREAQLFNWYLGKYPFAVFQYSIGYIQNQAQVFAVHAVVDGVLSIVDFGFKDLKSAGQAQHLLDLFLAVAAKARAKEIEFETSSELVAERSQRCGFWNSQTISVYYQLPDRKRQLLSSDEVFETRLGSDVLPKSRGFQPWA